jgi:malate/lactate dehydrogenase
MKVGIVGCGFVGSSGADAMALKAICLSLPRVVGLKGILTELRPYLSIDEHLVLQESAGTLQEGAVSLNIK